MMHKAAMGRLPFYFDVIHKKRDHNMREGMTLADILKRIRYILQFNVRKVALFSSDENRKSNRQIALARSNC